MKEYIYNQKLSLIVDRELNKPGCPEFETEHRDGLINLFTAWMWKLINKRYKHHNHVRNATLKDWRKPILEAVEYDGRTLKDLKEVFKYSYKDDFWRNKIISPAGLKRNYASAYDDMKMKEARKEKKSKPKPVVRANAAAYQYV